MSGIRKRAIPLIAVLLLIVACSTASPTTVSTEQIITPTEPTLEQPSATIPPTEVPVIPTDTQEATESPLPLGGSGVIVFGSDKDGDYTNIYLFNITEKKYYSDDHECIEHFSWSVFS